MPNAILATAGHVRFQDAPGNRGTELIITLEYEALGSAILSKVIEPITTAQLKSDLRRFKQWMETGEVATTEGQPAGARSKREPQRREPELQERRRLVAGTMSAATVH